MLCRLGWHKWRKQYNEQGQMYRTCRRCQEDDDPGARAYGLLVDAAAALIAAGRRLPKVGKPARAATAVEFAETIWAALHGIVSLKLTCPAFPTSPAEVLTPLMVESLLGTLTDSSVAKNGSQRKRR